MASANIHNLILNPGLSETIRRMVVNIISGEHSINNKADSIKPKIKCVNSVAFV